MDLLSLMNTQSFYKDPAIIQRAIQELPALYYKISGETLGQLLSAARLTRDGALCEFLARLYHIEANLGLAAMLALTPDETPQYLFTEASLFTTEILTAVLDFYVSSRLGGTAGSIASVLYTDDATPGVGCGGGGSPNMSSSLTMSSANFTKQFRSNVINRTNSALMSTRGSYHMGDLDIVGGGGLSSSAPMRKNYGLLGAGPGGAAGGLGGMTVTTGVTARAQNESHLVFPELLQIPTERIVGVIEAVMARSDPSYILSFLMQTRHIVSDAASGAPAGPVRSVTLAGVLGDDVSEDLHGDDGDGNGDGVASPGVSDSQFNLLGDGGPLPLPLLPSRDRARASGQGSADGGTGTGVGTDTDTGASASARARGAGDPLASSRVLRGMLTSIHGVRARPLIQSLPTETIEVVEADAFNIVDRAFRHDLLRVVGQEYTQRGLHESAILAFSKIKDAEHVAEIVLAMVAGLTPELVARDEALARARILLTLQACFTLYMAASPAFLERVVLLVYEHEPACRMQSALLDVLKDEVLSGFVCNTRTARFLAMDGVYQFDKQALRKIQKKDLRVQENRTLQLNSHVMLCLMQCGTGKPTAALADSLSGLERWDRFTRTAIEGVIYRNTDTLTAGVYADHFDVLGAGRSGARKMDNYELGGALLGTSLMYAGLSSFAALSPLALLLTASDYVEGAAAAPPGAKDESAQALVQGYALALGISSLGKCDAGTTDLLVGLLGRDMEHRPDALFGVLLGIGLVNLGNEQLLRDATFRETHICRWLASEHERVRRAAALCLALFCYGREEAACETVGYLLGYEASSAGAEQPDSTPRAAAYGAAGANGPAGAAGAGGGGDAEPKARNATASSFKYAVRRGGCIALGLAYTGTNSLDVAKTLLTLATDSTPGSSVEEADDVGVAAIVALSYVFLHNNRYAVSLLSIVAQSHKASCRQGAALALGYIMSGTWDAEAVDLLLRLAGDHEEWVRANAYIGMALVLQGCPAPALPDPVRIESDLPLGDRQKNTVYACEHRKADVDKLRHRNKLLRTPGKLPDRYKETAAAVKMGAFDLAAMMRGPTLAGAPAEASVGGAGAGTDAGAGARGASSGLDVAVEAAEAAGTTEAVPSKDSEPSGAAVAAAAAGDRLQSVALSPQEFAAQFRADLLGALTERKYIENTTLGVRACLLALGILNAGGFNMSFSLITPVGLPNEVAIAGSLLFAESAFWHPLTPCLALGFTADAAISVLPQIAFEDEGVQVTFADPEAMVLLRSEYLYAYPAMTTEASSVNIEKYTKSAKLSFDAANRQIRGDGKGADAGADGICGGFNFVREANTLATRIFLREAENVHLGDLLQRTGERAADTQDEAAGGAAAESQYVPLNTPCRLLRSQVGHVINPHNSEYRLVGKICRGVFVVAEADEASMLSPVHDKDVLGSAEIDN